MLHNVKPEALILQLYVFFKDTTSNYPIDRAVTPPKFVEALIRATSLVSALEESSCSECVIAVAKLLL